MKQHSASFRQLSPWQSNRHPKPRFFHQMQTETFLLQLDFNGGADSSRSIQKVQVDTSRTVTGKSLVAAKMVVNGNANPAPVSTERWLIGLRSHPSPLI